MRKVVEEIKKMSGVRMISDEELISIAEKVTGKVLKPKPTEQLEAMVWVKCGSNVLTSSVARRISLIDGVKEVNEVTGDFDLVVRVVAPNHLILNEILDAIRGVKGVESTHTQIVLKRLSK